MHTVEFVGIQSGDHECFCFAVTADEFRRLTGADPDEYDQSPFHPDLYRYYPDYGPEDGKAVRVRIAVEPVP